MPNLVLSGHRRGDAAARRLVVVDVAVVDDAVDISIVRGGYCGDLVDVMGSPE